MTHGILSPLLRAPVTPSQGFKALICVGKKKKSQDLSKNDCVPFFHICIFQKHGEVVCLTTSSWLGLPRMASPWRLVLWGGKASRASCEGLFLCPQGTLDGWTVGRGGGWTLAAQVLPRISYWKDVSPVLKSSFCFFSFAIYQSCQVSGVGGMWGQRSPNIIGVKLAREILFCFLVCSPNCHLLGLFLAEMGLRFTLPTNYYDLKIQGRYPGSSISF